MTTIVTLMSAPSRFAGKRAPAFICSPLCCSEQEAAWENASSLSGLPDIAQKSDAGSTSFERTGNHREEGYRGRDANAILRRESCADIHYMRGSAMSRPMERKQSGTRARRLRLDV